MNTAQVSIDKTAIGLSLACAIHCLMMPVAVAVIPALAASFLADEGFHFFFLVLVLPTSLVALGMGCSVHHRNSVVLLGLLGLFTLTTAFILGHEVLGESGEKIATVIGSAIIGLAHIRNFSLCQQQANPIAQDSSPCCGQEHD